jgi:hypothetical protein
MNRDALFELAVELAGHAVPAGSLLPAQVPQIAQDILICYNATLLAYSKTPERGEAKLA